MARCFCVMTHEEEYDAKTGKMSGKFLNHRVLMGKQEQIDDLKKLFEEEVKGDFTVRLQEKAM